MGIKKEEKNTVSTSGPKETQAVNVTGGEVEEASSVPPCGLQSRVGGGGVAIPQGSV